MLAELNKYGIQCSASYLCQDWAEAKRRRQGRQSMALKTEDARSPQGSALW